MKLHEIVDPTLPLAKSDPYRGPERRSVSREDYLKKYPPGSKERALIDEIGRKNRKKQTEPTP